VALFFLGFAVASFLANNSLPVSVGDIVNPLATLVAAFMGAWTAFRLQSLQKHEEEKKSQIAAGNRALSTLLQQANTLKLFQVDFIEPIRSDPGRHIAMRPTLPYQEDAMAFDLKSLDYLAHPQHQQTLFDLSIEEERFREALKAINARSRLHFEIVQPMLMAAGIQDGHEYTGEEFRKAIGEFHYLNLLRLTDAVVIHVDRTVESLYSMKDRFRKTLSTQFPDGKFIDFELLNDPPRSALL
jgi:hypothetical protein